MSVYVWCDYPPQGSLAAFNGENPQGTWTLTVSDEEAGDGGSLDKWGLNICVTPEIVNGTEHLGAQNITFFPNPSQGNLTINSSFTFDEDVQR